MCIRDRSLLTSPASAVIVVVPPDNARVMVAVLVWAGTGMLMMVPALIWVSLARGANLAPFAVASMVSPSNVWDPPCIVPRAASSVLFAGSVSYTHLDVYKRQAPSFVLVVRVASPTALEELLNLIHRTVPVSTETTMILQTYFAH